MNKAHAMWIESFRKQTSLLIFAITLSDFVSLPEALPPARWFISPHLCVSRISHQPLQAAWFSTHTHPHNFFPWRSVSLLILLPRPPSASHMFFFPSSCFSQCFEDELEMRKQETQENAEKQTRKVYSSEFFIRCRCFFVIIRREVGWEYERLFMFFFIFRITSHHMCTRKCKKTAAFVEFPNLFGIHRWIPLKVFQRYFVRALVQSFKAVKLWILLHASVKSQPTVETPKSFPNKPVNAYSARTLIRATFRNTSENKREKSFGFYVSWQIFAARANQKLLSTRGWLHATE